MSSDTSYVQPLLSQASLSKVACALYDHKCPDAVEWKDVDESTREVFMTDACVMVKAVMGLFVQDTYDEFKG
jgi:hypothetical protein